MSCLNFQTSFITLSSTREEFAFEVFTRAFTEFGIPDSLRTDNGNPFANGQSFYNLTKLSVWWMRHGINLERINPGHPEENGRHDLTDSLKRISAIATQVKSLDHNSDEFDDYDLSELVSTEVKNLRGSKSISQLGLKLEFNGEPNLKPHVSKSEICRIVQNLVLNSAQASTSGDNIEITVARMKDEATIQVRDRGCGIPQHLQEQVFEPDYTSKPGLGTGLGLSIVQHICHQRGGTVALDSEVGKGTSVRVSFPLVREVIHAT